jgi:hypothetical protein
MWLQFAGAGNATASAYVGWDVRKIGKDRSSSKSRD